MTVRDFVIPKAMLACKVFLKKWPHWGSCECTGWWTPNTVLYMEEKPRGEKRFWRASAGWPVADRNQEVSAAQHQERKERGHCKHLYFRGGRGRRFLLLSRKLRVSLQLWCARKLRGIDGKAGRSLAPHQIVQHDGHQSRRRVAIVTIDNLRVSVWHQDRRNVMLSRRGGGNQACQHAEKWTLFETVHSLILTQMISWCPKFDFCFQKSKREKPLSPT